MKNRTRRTLETLVRIINETRNRPPAAYIETTLMGNKAYASCPGHIFLDHNSIYGGYLLSEMCESGGERTLSGDRKTAREMEAFLRGILLGL